MEENTKVGSRYTPIHLINDPFFRTIFHDGFIIVGRTDKISEGGGLMPIEWLVERANVTQRWKKGEGESRGPDEERPGLRLLGVE